MQRVRSSSQLDGNAMHIAAALKMPMTSSAGSGIAAHFGHRTQPCTGAYVLGEYRCIVSCHNGQGFEAQACAVDLRNSSDPCLSAGSQNGRQLAEGGCTTACHSPCESHAATKLGVPCCMHVSMDKDVYAFLTQPWHQSAQLRMLAAESSSGAGQEDRLDGVSKASH